MAWTCIWSTCRLYVHPLRQTCNPKFRIWHGLGSYIAIWYKIWLRIVFECNTNCVCILHYFRATQAVFCIPLKVRPFKFRRYILLSCDRLIIYLSILTQYRLVAYADWQIQDNTIYRASIASRGKNCFLCTCHMSNCYFVFLAPCQRSCPFLRLFY